MGSIGYSTERTWTRVALALEGFKDCLCVGITYKPLIGVRLKEFSSFIQAAFQNILTILSHPSEDRIYWEIFEENKNLHDKLHISFKHFFLNY